MNPINKYADNKFCIIKCKNDRKTEIIYKTIAKLQEAKIKFLYS